MRRKKTREEEFAEAEAADAEQAAKYAAQRACSHFDCQPTAWHFSGKVREMTCNECGATNWIEED